MIQDYFKLAYKSARQRKMRSWLTMIGIFVGIAAVVALISLSQGLKVAISQQFLSLGTDKLIVQAAGGGFGPPGTAVSKPLTEKDKSVIEKVRGVDLVVGRLIRIVQMKFNDEIKYGYVVTMPKNKEEQVLTIEANNYKLAEGKFLENEDSFEVLIGNDFADDFFDKSLHLRDTIVLQDHEFKVVGILQKSGNPQQDGTIILPESPLRKILGVDDIYDIIPLRVEEGENVDVVAENIREELRKEHNVDEGKEDFSVETPQQVLSILNNILAVVQGVLVGIAAISLVVGGIGIMNTMYTAVIERTKEIGVMKAVGATSKNIMLLFLIESGFLGLFGGIIGVTLGFGISKLIEIISFQIFESALITAEISLSLLFGALLFAFSVGAISGVFPARQAAKLKPVEAFRR
ncbi:MAG: ABC transporter permease [archaeon]|nr:ABC transporter permease [archaeon]